MSSRFLHNWIMGRSYSLVEIVNHNGQTGLFNLDDEIEFSYICCIFSIEFYYRAVEKIFCISVKHLKRSFIQRWK